MKNKTEKFLSVRDMVLCALFAALIAAGAFIRVPLPYVPFTLQFLFTNLAGLLLGKKRGLIAVCLYIFVGLSGIPVFTQGGGPGYILQPSFGYIVGFAFGTYLTGLIAERGKKSLMNAMLAGSAGFAVMFLFGLAHLYLIMNFYLASPLGLWKTIVIGFLPFAPGDLLIVIVSAFFLKRLGPAVFKQVKAT